MDSIKTYCKNIHVRRIIRDVRIEPVAFLFFISMGLFSLVSQIGTYRVICYHTIGDNPNFDCSNLGHGRGHGHADSRRGDPHNWNHTLHWNLSYSHHNEPVPKHQSDSTYQDLEIKIQQASAKWHMAFSLAHMVPALFADTFLGSLGDRHGRKANILIGVAGMMVYVFSMAVIFAFPKAPLYTLVLSNVVSGFTGYQTIIMISCFAYLADTVVDRRMLTVRMTYFSILMSVSSIISPLIGGGLLRVLSYAQTALVCQAVLACAFFAALMCLRQMPPALMRKMLTDRYIEEHGHEPPDSKTGPAWKNSQSSASSENSLTMENGTVPPPDSTQNLQPKAAPAEAPCKKRGALSEMKWISRNFFQLWKDVYRTYTKNRVGNARMYLLIASSVYFLHIAFEAGLRTSVFSLYVQKSPFYWGANEMSYYRSVNGGLHLAGSMIGIVLMKKICKLHDTTIILIAMGLHTCETLLFAFARTTGGLFAAAAAGCVTTMMLPCLKSFIAQVVDADEVGKSFTAFGIAANIAFAISSVLYSSVYALTVGWYPGFAFLMGSALEVVCFAGVFWMHLDYNYAGSFKCMLKSHATLLTSCVRRGKKPDANTSS